MMTTPPIRVIALAALLPAVAFSQASPQQGKPALENKRSSSPSPQSQERITREVRHELLGIPQLGVFDHLSFEVDGSKVTLLGSATLPVIKQNAERAVKDIEGVEQVDNKIDVLPVNSADQQIRLAAFRAIYGQPSLQRYAVRAIPPIHIIVNRGHITLEGVVLNKTDSQIAETQARTLPGVFSVTNNLRVEQGTADRQSK
jgi:hyperosmotically inducible protein